MYIYIYIERERERSFAGLRFWNLCPGFWQTLQTYGLTNTGHLTNDKILMTALHRCFLRHAPFTSLSTFPKLLLLLLLLLLYVYYHHYQ